MKAALGLALRTSVVALGQTGCVQAAGAAAGPAGTVETANGCMNFTVAQEDQDEPCFAPNWSRN